MRLSFFSSVALRDRRKTFEHPVGSGETSEPRITVLPKAPFKHSLKTRRHAPFNAGERVVLLSLTAGGWIDSGFKGRIVSIESQSDSMGRSVPKAQVVWDANDKHPSRSSLTALSRLRHET